MFFLCILKLDINYIYFSFTKDKKAKLNALNAIIAPKNQ